MTFYLSTQIYPIYRANCIRNLNSKFVLFKDFYIDLNGTYPENTDMKRVRCPIHAPFTFQSFTQSNKIVALPRLPFSE